MKSQTNPDADPPSKGTLFCPVCDHESPADGDWRHRTDSAGEEYVCPDCGTTIDNRGVAPVVTP